jgi:hypothetical protein
MNVGYPEVALHNGTALYVTCLNANTFDTTLSTGNVMVVGAWQGSGLGHFDRVLYNAFWGSNAPFGIPLDVAQSIDTKIDDGYPSSGVFGVTTTANGCAPSATAYTAASSCNVGVGKWIGSGE